MIGKHIAQKNVWIVCLAAFLFAALFVASCTSGIRLNTKGAPYSDAGTYRVIFFGCNFNNDLETIAFLDKEGGKYTFEPYAPDFKFRIKKGVAGKEALQEAEEFVKCNSSFLHAWTYGIIGP